MKIIQTPARFYPYIGGTEQVAFYEASELAKRGHNVKVICANEPAVGSGMIGEVSVQRIPYITKLANTNITLSLAKVLLEGDFDIIHTHLPHPWTADISAIVSKIKNKPLFLTYHNDVTGRGVNKVIAKMYNLTALRFLLNMACKVFITHENYLKNSAFLSPFFHKVVVTPPGVDFDRFRPLKIGDKRFPSVFFLSKLDKFHRYKGLDYLISSIKKVRETIPLTLYVGGDGELAEYYKQLAKDQEVEEAVVFLGGLTDNQVVEYYNICDVFVLPSVSSIQEGFGLVALEAMACKKPVVVTNIVGVAKDIEKENAGIVISPKDVDALADAIKHLLLNEDDRKSMGRRAYDLVHRKYTWEKHADAIEKEYLAIAK